MDVALLIARLIIGLTLAAHGMQKLLRWFSGYALKGTAGFFESIGFRPGLFFGATAGLGEVAGGLLTATGLLGPISPSLFITVMVVAIVAVHLPNGFFSQANGYESPACLRRLGFRARHSRSGDVLGWMRSPVCLECGTRARLGSVLQHIDLADPQPSRRLR